MTLRNLIALTGVAVLALGGVGCRRSANPEGGGAGAAAFEDATAFLPKAAGRPPNILLVTVDTLRADQLSA